MKQPCNENRHEGPQGRHGHDDKGNVGGDHLKAKVQHWAGQGNLESGNITGVCNITGGKNLRR